MDTKHWILLVLVFALAFAGRAVFDLAAHQASKWSARRVHGALLLSIIPGVTLLVALAMVASMAPAWLALALAAPGLLLLAYAATLAGRLLRPRRQGERIG